ncbi:MAG: hypothetical protein QM564_00355 [Bergeyella sp.]
MKKIVKYFVVFIAYNVLGAIVWYKQDLLLPMFVATFALINTFMMDRKESFLNNFISISGVMIVCEIIVLFLEGSYKPIAFQYIGLMTALSLIIYYLKKNYTIGNNLPA